MKLTQETIKKSVDSPGFPLDYQISRYYKLGNEDYVYKYFIYINSKTFNLKLSI